MHLLLDRPPQLCHIGEMSENKSLTAKFAKESQSSQTESNLFFFASFAAFLRELRG
jgi:hypothetical protein